MSTKFINILENRIITSSIKRYRPVEELKLVLYYTVSRYRIDNETFTFPTEQARNEMLDRLDIIFDCYEGETKRIRVIRVK